MPGNQTGRHPSGHEIVFDEASHTYVDDQQQFYRSFTTLIHDYFPEFNAEEVAGRIAAKRGCEPSDLVHRWKDAGEEACRYGTCVHENCEFRMKGMPEPNQPENDLESFTFGQAVRVVDYLKSRFQFIAAEKILFSPRCLVAGTVDLMMAEGNILWILDYKTNREIKENGFGNGFPPLDHLRNCNFEHYAMQLSLAEVIAKFERYIPMNTICRRALIHFPPMQEPRFIETPDRSAESYQILLDYVARNGVPF